MKATSKQIAGIAITIWITALITNTCIGLIIVSNNVKMDFLDTALKGISYGVIFSFPIYIFIWFLILMLHKAKFTAGNIFLLIFVVGGFMTFGSFYIFSKYLNLTASLNIPLGTCAIISSSIGIIVHYGALKKVCFRRDHPGHFPRE